MKYLVCIVIVFSFYTSSLIAQVAITAVPFLQINNNASSVGLAEADVARLYSANGLHLNPALIGNPNTIEASTQFNGVDGFGLGTDWLSTFNGDLSVTTPHIIISFNRLSVGYQHTYFDLGEQFLTGIDDPAIISSFRPREYSNTFTLAYSVNDYVRIGLGINRFTSALFGGNSVGSGITSGDDFWDPDSERENSRIEAKGSSFDFGVYTQYPFENSMFHFLPSIGLSVTDFGQPISYDDYAQEDPLPMQFRTGFGFDAELKEKLASFKLFKAAFYGAVSKTMARREADGTPYKPLKALFRSWDTFEYFNGQETASLSVREQFRTHLGTEFTFMEILNFRFGSFYEHENNGARAYNTFGIGLHYKYVSFDYAELFPADSESSLRDTKYYQFSVKLPFSLFYSSN